MARVRYRDAEGRPTRDPALATEGEVVDYDADDQPRRVTRFWLQQNELPSWLPVGEAAFLLWVLVALLAAWLLVGVVLGLV